MKTRSNSVRQTAPTSERSIESHGPEFIADLFIVVLHGYLPAR
jgi:hypothetical protein